MPNESEGALLACKVAAMCGVSHGVLRDTTACVWFTDVCWGSCRECVTTSKPAQRSPTALVA